MVAGRPDGVAGAGDEDPPSESPVDGVDGADGADGAADAAGAGGAAAGVDGPPSVSPVEGAADAAGVAGADAAGLLATGYACATGSGLGFTRRRR